VSRRHDEMGTALLLGSISFPGLRHH